jgi:hypothetical protein
VEAKVTALFRSTFAFLAVLHQDEAGQEGLEYIMATAAIAIGFALAIVAGVELLIPQALSLVCNTVDPLGSGSCLS